MARHLRIDFSWILIDLGGQVNAKLGSNIDKKRSKKALKNRCQKEGDTIGKNRHLGASWAVLNAILGHLILWQWGFGGYAWASLKAKLGLFCPSV